MHEQIRSVSRSGLIFSAHPKPCCVSISSSARQLIMENLQHKMSAFSVSLQANSELSWPLLPVDCIIVIWSHALASKSTLMPEAEEECVHLPPLVSARLVCKAFNEAFHHHDGRRACRFLLASEYAAKATWVKVLTEKADACSRRLREVELGEAEWSELGWRRLRVSLQRRIGSIQVRLIDIETLLSVEELRLRRM